METLAYYSIKNEKCLDHWDLLIDQWANLIERFTRISAADAPFWYDKQANLGILAASAWHCGRIALEKFQHAKIEVSTDEDTEAAPRNGWDGRCDLWISNEQSAEIIGSNFKWLNMQSEKMAEAATSCLELAFKTALDMRGSSDIRAIGVAFLPVYAEVEKVGDASALEQVIATTISSVQELPADLAAWCFPKRLRTHIGEKYNNYQPGIILLAKAA